MYKLCNYSYISNRKEVERIDENGEKIPKIICYILQFIDSARIMASSLSDLVNNLSEGINRIKCKFGRDDKKCETCRIKYMFCDCFRQYRNFKDDLIEYKCLCCNKNYQHKFDEKLEERFLNTYKFSNHDTNKTSLPEKEEFHIHLNMEDITAADYSHAKRVCKDF